MKKHLISALLVMAGFGMNAQLVEVNSMQRVAVPEGMIVSMPTISPDGSFVVVSEAGNDALTKIALDGSTQRVSGNGSAYDLKISADGKTVVFRQTVTGKNNLRQTALKSVDLATGKETEIVKASRKLNTGFTINQNSVTAVEGGKMRVKSLSGTAVKAPVVSIDYGHLVYTAYGKSTVLDPQGRGSYLWPSISPDGTKIVYFLVGGGCYVCNIDGTGAKALGAIRAPKWLGNDKIVGMADQDNGEFVTASSLIVANLSGDMQRLTGEEVVAMYPSVSANGKNIAFATPAGELFIINLK